MKKTLPVILAAALLAACAMMPAEAPQENTEAVAMLKAAGLDPAATSEDDTVPPLLTVARYLAHYGAEIVPIDGDIKDLSWCPGEGGEEVVGYEIQCGKIVPHGQDPLTPWLDVESCRFFVAADMDSVWARVRSIGVTGAVSAWTESCAVGDSCGTLTCGVPE